MTGLMSLVGLSLIASPLIYFSGHLPVVLHNRRINASQSLAFIMLVILFLLIGSTRWETLGTYQLGTIPLHMDGVGLVLSGLALTLGVLVVAFSGEELTTQPDQEKYYALILLLIGMLIGLVCAGDLFNLWVWFEGVTISSYMLVGFYRENQRALGASIKYFIQTVSGSIFVLFGIALVFMQTGTLSLASQTMISSPILVVAGAFFVIGFGVKMALFPGFTWLPDAYAEAPTGISALLSGVVTISAFIALLKALSLIIGSSSADWGFLLALLGTLNIIIGNLLALAQTQVKRLLAYSSISHIGYIVLAIGIGISTQSVVGMRGGMLHLLIHGWMKALAFFIVGALAFALKRRQNAPQLVIHDLNGVACRYPGMAIALVIALLSLVGIPPLAGFYSKWQILMAGFSSDSLWVLVLIALAALNSVFSLAYYLPIINALYVPNESGQWEHTPDLPRTMRVPIIFLAVLIVAVGIYPAILDSLIDPAAEALLTLLGV